MAAAAKKGAIQLGLVYIPVSMYTIVTEGRASFNQLQAIPPAGQQPKPGR